MQNTRLVIMSVDNNYTVGYTEDNQFVKIPYQPSHKVGQIIKYNPPKPKGRDYWKIAIAASILLIFFTGIINPFIGQEAQAAYLSVGFNTGSIELWTNENNKVVKISYADSIKELEKLNLNDKNVYEAMLALISEAKKRGLISKAENNILLVDLVDLTQNNEHFIKKEKIKTVVLKGLDTDNFEGLMLINRHDEQYLEEAVKLNLSVSEYHIYQKSNAQGHALNTDKLHQGHMRSTLEEAGTTPEQIFDMHNNTMHGKTNSNFSENPNPSDTINLNQEKESDHSMERDLHNEQKEIKMNNHNSMHK